MRYVIRRLLQTIVVVFGVSIVAFGMTYLTGDPTEVILGAGADQMTVQQIDDFRVKMGFDRPWYVQYVDFATKALQGDFGSNRMSWVDDKFEAMFKAFTQEFDQSKWQKMCWDMEAYAAEQAPVVWLYNVPALYGVSARLDFTPRGDGRMYLNLVLKGLK